MADVNSALKTCSKCGQVKPATETFFYKHKSGKGGLRPDCKSCHAIRTQQYAKEHQQQIAEYKRVYRKRNPGINRRYYEKNRHVLIPKMAEYNRMNRDAYLARMRKWRRENPTKVQVWVRNRRAKLRGSLGQHSHDDVLALLASQNGLCVYCRADLGESCQVDHIIPVSRGGSNDASNLQLLCKSCNLLKRDKMPEEFSCEIGVGNG